jgi:dTDP-4-amino-4,6-dideoxygalactose transaminase
MDHSPGKATHVPRFPETIGTFMGRDALALAASYLAPDPESAVLLPAYNCPDVLRSFARANRVIFYDIREDLSIDPNVVTDSLRRNKVCALVLINYFGFLQPHRNEIKESCLKSGVILIEDCAHSLLTEGSGETGDIVIHSFRKILPTLDGGGLRVNLKEKPLNAAFRPRWNSDLLSALIKTKTLLNFHSNTFNRAKLESHVPLTPPTKSISNGEPKLTLPLSRFAETAIAKASFPEIVERRRADFEYWLAFCKSRQKLTPLFSTLPSGVCPLGFPVLLSNPTHVEEQARKVGITLRVHWRLDATLSPECRVSQELAKRMITLPIYLELNSKEKSALSSILSNL